ncbi:elongation factor P [Oceanispirochaeta sp.]|jgi:elongation factor P|uniref:elongation factor P n=1 Tax=Oceanispirochaeta sp. TaxID=2035350 RepID=UPI00260687AF|nr:elongation factor P [Oceanispirochaeta sp.]MDA3955223.1 elongation factor P [Oceanispirochaeta sp.]
MGQIKAGAVAKGTFLLEKETPFIVVEREFVNPGKGSAFARLKLKNLRTGAVLKVTHKTQDALEEIDVEDVSSQYLYSDGESYHFMNADTFDQYEIPMASMEEMQYFLKEGESYKVVRWGSESLDIKLPPKMDFLVTEAEDAVKGDTVQGATKYVKVETGLTVKVPIFIKEGETIRVNVETKEYQERINN